MDPSALVESGPERAWEIDRLGSPDGRPRTSPKNGSVASDFLLRARAREAFELIDLNGNGSLDVSLCIAGPCLTRTELIVRLVSPDLRDLAGTAFNRR